MSESRVMAVWGAGFAAYAEVEASCAGDVQAALQALPGGCDAGVAQAVAEEAWRDGEAVHGEVGAGRLRVP